ncbi:hypothetical protein [Mycobacterium interjectum]|uniref:hypothetical protein n=1 Tax=Mycobacterium interjectum TaxID=33895 RepID=UPI001155E725|nr:hypothetical protein [Mycobacterium interjectum]
MADLFNRLDVEYRNVEYNLLSPERHENDSAPDDPRRLKLISAAQAAELLGISERSAQRNYEKLGGQMVSGVCVFDRDAVLKRAGRTSA